MKLLVLREFRMHGNPYSPNHRANAVIANQPRPNVTIVEVDDVWALENDWFVFNENRVTS
jgi:hypothetical protein